MTTAEASWQGLTVSVFGASGFVGSLLCGALATRGADVRAVGRRLPKLPHGPRILPLVADVAALAPGDPALDCDVAVYLVHSIEDVRQFRERDRALASHFARVAARSPRLARIVYVGTTGGPGLPGHIPSRHEVGQLLKGAGKPLLELRVGSVFGPAGMPLHVVRLIVQSTPFLLVPPAAQHRMPIIGVEDLLSAILDSRELGTGIYDVYSDVWTYERAWNAFAAAMHLRRRRLPIPPIPNGLAALGMCMLAPRRYRLLRAVMPVAGVDLVPGQHGATPLRVGSEPDPVRRAVDLHAAWVEQHLADDTPLEDMWLATTRFVLADRGDPIDGASFPRASARLAQELGARVSASEVRPGRTTFRLPCAYGCERWLALICRREPPGPARIEVIAAARAQGLVGSLTAKATSVRDALRARRALRRLFSSPSAVERAQGHVLSS